MAQRLIAPLAPGIELQPGYTVRLAALDPTTGAAVNGVTVSSVSMQVDVSEADTGTDGKDDLTAPLFMYGG